MDFLLGILTGITICFAWGHYLNNQRKKEQKERADKWRSWFGEVIRDPRSASEQLQDAVDREDWEEAARLRDLINKR